MKLPRFFPSEKRGNFKTSRIIGSVESLFYFLSYKDGVKQGKGHYYLKSFDTFDLFSLLSNNEYSDLSCLDCSLLKCSTLFKSKQTRKIENRAENLRHSCCLYPKENRQTNAGDYAVAKKILKDLL